jgi:hypothetical protein
LQAFGRTELLERLMVAAAARVEHPGRQVQHQSDVWSDVCLQCPCGALHPLLTLVELAHPVVKPARMTSAGAITGSVPQAYRSASATASRQRRWVTANGWLFDANPSWARQPTLKSLDARHTSNMTVRGQFVADEPMSFMLHHRRGQQDLLRWRFLDLARPADLG